MMADDNETIPDCATGGDRVTPTQGRDKEPVPRDTGKSARSTIWEKEDRSVLERLHPFYHIDENDLREHRIMRFPFAISNPAIIEETLKIIDKMRYEDITRNFIEYTNGVSVVRI